MPRISFEDGNANQALENVASLFCNKFKHRKDNTFMTTKVFSWIIFNQRFGLESTERKLHRGAAVSTSRLIEQNHDDAVFDHQQMETNISNEFREKETSLKLVSVFAGLGQNKTSTVRFNHEHDSANLE